MKTTINQYEFIRAFKDMNRGGHFTNEGLRCLFNYLEGYEEDTGEEIELDVIALCCEYTEYSCLEEFQDAHGADEYSCMEEIESMTEVIQVDDDAFIIQSF